MLALCRWKPYISPAMRDLFEDIHRNEPIDPVQSARRGLRSSLRRRFYTTASVSEGADGVSLHLDSRPVRTPAGKLLAVPTLEVANALAAEWQAQTEVIDPARMPLTRLANSIIDGVVERPQPVAAEIAKYLGADLLFYRAATPAALVERQARHWNPILAWARTSLGAHFVLAEGMVHVAQPNRALEAASSAIPTDPWHLGAAHTVTTLTGSALIALALVHGQVAVDDAWAAAHVDEDWNEEHWGRDELAAANRAFRYAEMQAAAIVLQALANGR